MLFIILFNDNRRKNDILELAFCGFAHPKTTVYGKKCLFGTKNRCCYFIISQHIKQATETIIKIFGFF